MREFDLNGLRLAEYQAQLFEYSAEHLECSSAVFLRRFLHSDLLKILDLNESLFYNILTICWIVGITNAINFIDGLDGLAAGTASISSLSLLFISIF